MPQTIFEKRVLLVDAGPVTRAFFARALGAPGAPVQCASTRAEAEALLEHEGPWHAVFVDWENVELISHVRDRYPGLRAVLITSVPVYQQGRDVVGAVPFAGVHLTSVVARADEYDPLVVSELVSTSYKLLSGDLFGLEKYLGVCAGLATETIGHSSQRRDAIDRVFEAAVKAGLRTKYARQLQALTDELLMNAIWDAPIDESGAEKYNAQQRDVPVALAPGEHVELRYGSNGNTFGVSVTDNFGRLDGARVVAQLLKCFSEPEPSAGAGGAGLGLYMAYNIVSSLVINVSPGERTEVIGLLHLHHTSGRTRLGDRGRSFCFFCTDDERSA